MKTFIFSEIDLGNLPYCSTPKSYQYAEDKANELFFYGKWTPNDCDCSPQCKKILFTSSLESTTDRYKIRSKRSMARVRIYYQVCAPSGLPNQSTSLLK